jgi:eukaryotic-like serine/threonine-protein kinase
MALSPGTKLGSYEILTAVGAGGMGEVYRARDTRLDRIVAIKVVSEHLAHERESHERFVREARAISVLNHPHICTLHDVGQQDGLDYLVMEFVEGESLSARLCRGALPIDEVLRCGIEISDALAKAHRQGIVHRDLKPANIMLTKSGVKLLDFGLAKAMPNTGDRDAALTAMATSSRPLTGQGRMVGTLHYMAPEQLEGKDADMRSDIFAFGAVLYEMVTAKKAFDAKSAASVIAAILEHDPPSMNALQPMAPPALERVVKTCLAKDPDDRWQTAHDVQLELKWIREGGSQAGVPATVVVRRKKRERLAWAIGLVSAVVVLALVTAYVRLVSIRPPVLISSILPPAGARFAFIGSRSGVPQISPDGRMLLFVATDAEGTNMLWLRSLDSSAGRPLAGTEAAELPFWSADSRSIAFFAGGKLKTIQVAGGAVVPLYDVSQVAGGSWNQQGVILFETALDSGLYQIPASGGAPRLVLRFDKSKFNAYAWPNFLPDGKHFTYTAFGNEGDTGIYFASMDGHENKLVTRATGNTGFASGFLFYSRPNGSSADLVAQTFDPSSGRVEEEPRVVVQGIEYQQGPDQAAFAVSDRLLIYQLSPTGTATTHSVVWLDRSGKKLSVVAPGQDSFDLRLSPDGKRLAYSKGGPNSDIWIQELKRDVPMRVTFDTSVDKGAPTWSPDGNEILFDIALGGKTPPGIYRKSSSSTGAERLLAKPEQADLMLWPTDWSRDGRFILAVQGEIVSRNRGEIWVLPTSPDGRPRIFIRAPGAAYDGQFSPNGHWVAYVSRESGREEVYVVPFDGNQVLNTEPLHEVTIARKWQVSAKGGAFPRWRRDGQELFYVGAGNEFMATKIQAQGNVFSVGEAKSLFRESLADAASPYDVSSDGQHFVVNSFGETLTLPLTLVENWKEFLKK